MNELLYSAGWHQACETLLAIRRGKEWSPEYADFEDYCKQRLGLSKTRAHLFCKFAVFTQICRDERKRVPEVPDLVAEILKLPQKSWLSAWTYCLELSDGPMTVKHIESVLDHFGFIRNKRQPQIVTDRRAAKVAGRKLAEIQDVESVKRPGDDWNDQTFEKAARLWEASAND